VSGVGFHWRLFVGRGELDCHDERKMLAVAHRGEMRDIV
jgi:hypothetical protein